ncbi:MAG: hypothetical protein C5B59_07620 [Bacteroidetes bacterium]|nr:MAG: hypothetical protein C5B59_07620 [Bacteroidota bacterium]
MTEQRPVRRTLEACEIPIAFCILADREKAIFNELKIKNPFRAIVILSVIACILYARILSIRLQQSYEASYI